MFEIKTQSFEIVFKTAGLRSMIARLKVSYILSLEVPVVNIALTTTLTKDGYKRKLTH